MKQLLRKFSLGCLLLFLLPIMTAWQPKELTWSIHPGSSIKIRGSSNVNTFSCEASGGFQSQPIQCRQAPESKTNMKASMSGSVSVVIESFDCKNRLLNNDMRKTLKSEEFPVMTIRFLDLERLPDLDTDVDFLSGRVQIELAGKQRVFYLRYSFNKTTNGFLLKGSRGFTFTDFDLSPPKKAGGLIKVNDSFDVGFTLILLAS